MNRHERRATLSVARKNPHPWEWEDRSAEACPRWPSTHPWGPLVAGYSSPIYAVMVFDRECGEPWGRVRHLAIRRHDGSPEIPWRDKQRIKDELVGAERVAVEVFPANSELVDQAHMFHLWVLADGVGLPFTIGGTKP